MPGFELRSAMDWLYEVDGRPLIPQAYCNTLTSQVVEIHAPYFNSLLSTREFYSKREKKSMLNFWDCRLINLHFQNFFPQIFPNFFFRVNIPSLHVYGLEDKVWHYTRELKKAKVWNSDQGATSLTVTAKSLWRQHFYFDDAYRHHHCHILNRMMIYRQRCLHRDRHVGVVINRYY